MGDAEMEWEGSELYVVEVGVGAVWPLAELELEASVDSEAVVMRDQLLSRLSLLKGSAGALGAWRAGGSRVGLGPVLGSTGGGVMEGCDGVSDNEAEWMWAAPHRPHRSLM